MGEFEFPEYEFDNNDHTQEFYQYFEQLGNDDFKAMYIGQTTKAFK